MKMQKGFTLIELMIVIAILGILIAIALPAYQDYSIRTKNSECLNVAAAAKLAVAEFRQSEGAYPGNAGNAGYTAQATKYCSAIVITAGVITMSTVGTGGAANYNLAPSTSDTASAITWLCTAPGVAKPGWVPKECRP
jgi:type IV pilus assembly protein PilA